MEIQRIENSVLILADAIVAIPAIPSIVAPVGAVLTDPPYSSGGAFRSDRAQSVATKYVNTNSENTSRENFSGDNRDQRSFLAWSTMVFSALQRAAVPGAALLAFTDWRQLPTMSDAVQSGGWVWRNVATWWKPGVRMQRGRFSSSAEYVVYGSNGPVTPGAGSPQNVLRHQPVPGAQKKHIAEKPVALLEELLMVTPAGALVCDPFMGSGSTAVAAIRTGRPFVGIEIDPAHFAVACARVRDEHASEDWLG